MVQYSPKGFFRQVSNQLLKRYFEDRYVSLDVKWDDLEEAAIDPIWDAWLLLDDAVREAADADFTDVGYLANQAGLDVIIQEGSWNNLDLTAEFEVLDDPHDAAMWTLLEHPEVFRVSSLFRTADLISTRSWHKWNGLPNAKPRDDEQMRGQLAASLSDYFLKVEARGRFCQVEVYQRSGDFYYFAFPEDYARAELDVVQGCMLRQTHRPVFQLVFVYSPARGTLDATAPGGKAVVEKLMKLALAAMHGTENAAKTKDERVYNFEPLREPDHQWIYPAGAGIADVWLKSLRLTFKAGKDRLVLEGENRAGVPALYDRLVSASGGPARIASKAVNLTQATIRVEFSPRGGRRVAPRDIRITWPNTCNLGQDKTDRILREMLIDSGIDPFGLGLETLR